MEGRNPESGSIEKWISFVDAISHEVLVLSGTEDEAWGDDVGDDCRLVPPQTCPDADGDGTPDACTGEEHVDTDGDNRADACDDEDGDGVVDVVDNCPNSHYNPGQENLDGDEFGDPCDPNTDGDRWPNEEDNCPVDHTEEEEPDYDDDEAGYVCDNCRGLANPAQSNPDNDAWGNACDPDDDNDNVPDNHRGGNEPGNDPCIGGQTQNCDDNCPQTYNPNQQDITGDGVGFACSDAAQPGFREFAADVGWIMAFLDRLGRFHTLPSLLNEARIPICYPELCGPEPMPGRFARVVDFSAPEPFHAVLLDGVGDIVQVKIAEHDSVSDSFRSTLTWEPGVGASYPSEYAFYGTIRTDSYSVRVIPTAESSLEEPGRVRLEHDVIVP